MSEKESRVEIGCGDAAAKIRADWNKVVRDAFSLPDVWWYPKVIVRMPDVAAGDPDGPLVPLPKREPPARVVPAFPASAYAAMLK